MSGRPWSSVVPRRSLPFILLFMFLAICELCIIQATAQQSSQPQLLGEITFTSVQRPARVDNTGKAILDDVASRLKSDPDSTIAVVGYPSSAAVGADGSGAKMVTQLAAQRAVNTKAYLVREQGIDPARISAFESSSQGAKVEIFLLRSGVSDSSIPGIKRVNETKVLPSSGATIPPKKASKRLGVQPGH